MMAKTHIVSGLAYGSLLLSAFARGNYTLEEYGLLVAGLCVGSVLPDIDHPHSLVSQSIPVVGSWISGVTKHRGFFHSVVGVVVLFFVVAFTMGGLSTILVSPLPFRFGAGLMIGYVLHIVGDILTVSGVRLLYPVKLRVSIPVFRTGGLKEAILQITLILFILYQVVGLFLK